MTFSESYGFSHETEQSLQSLYKTLSEKDRRRYVAVLAETLPHGGIKYLCKLLGCSPSTITRGKAELHELKQHGDPAEGRTRREGAGRPKKEEQVPEVLDKLESILENNTGGSPMQKDVTWTHLTFTAIASRLTQMCMAVSRPVVKRLCRSLGLKKRRMVKSVTKAPSRNRDEQFHTVAKLRDQFRKRKDPIFSMDSKRKEMLGNVERKGDVLGDGPVEVLDHALPSYADAEVITHGIYDVQRNHAHMNLNLSSDTGEFAADSLGWYWEHIARAHYADAGRMLLLCDCGGSNGLKSNVFKFHLKQLATEIGLPIRVAHYPVYCSKYNPIEHRVFPHVESAYVGRQFFDPEQMVTAIGEHAQTATGLKTTAHVIEEKYRPADNQHKKEAAKVEVKHDNRLPEYNYKVEPKSRSN